MSPLKYVLLDAARMNDQMDKAQKLNEQNICLYKGKEEQYLQTVAPYLFSYKFKTDFASWLQKEGWGNSWGVFVGSQASMEHLHIHFSKFKTVRAADGSEPYFRFYDPRVLRIFLPTCDSSQLKQFFGPVEKFICEDEDPQFALVFSFDGKRLITESASAGVVFQG